MNMIFSITILLHGLLSLIAISSAARILAIFPLPAKSHFSYSEAIMKSLHAAGHHITFISPFPEKNQSENYTTIDSRCETLIYVGRSDIEEFIRFSLSSLLHFVTEVEETNCYDVIKLKEIQEILHTTKKTYDVMFTELGVMYECYLPIAQKLAIPVIGVVPLRSSKYSKKIIGYYNNPAIVPFVLSDFGLHMSFSQRLMNLWSNIYMNYFYYTIISPKLKKFSEIYYSGWQQQKNKIAVTFYNNHASLLSQPLIPKAVEIGGIHIKPVTPLPQDLQKFIEEAEQGVILFTFGSVINASSLPAQKRIAFVNAFASIPQRVIWKFEGSIEGISENVLLSSWVPQRDILEHNNVKVFISHCGINGMYEAIYTGTPVVTIPLFADQQSNAALLKDLGVGVSLDIHTVTTEKVLDALNTIINDSRYDERMKNLSIAFKDRPLPPQKSVVYWTEYVIKHNGTSHLESVGSELPLYQYFMLDIFTFIAAVIITALMMMYYGGKKFYELISKCIKYSLPYGKKNN